MSSVVAAILGGTVDDKGQGNAMMHGPGGTKPAKPKPDPTVAELLTSYQVLTSALQHEIIAGEIKLSMQSRGLVVSFAQAALFQPGEDVISATAYGPLEKVARAIQKIPNPVRLEGHTDSRPIRNSQFYNNWELSSARSIAVLQILTDRFEVPHDRLSVAGYADTAPLASNDTEEGRARNRRVDIVILNEEGRKAEPLKLN
jgi:chemotaxis protein MotB